MAEQLDAPKVFISYSWQPPQHKLKVIALAERLVNDEVHVILDEWDLREGQDKNLFMEQMVTNPEIKRVLLICNKPYKEKADGRKGGVGAESLIVSDSIYSKADQTKFIPLVFEFDEAGQPYTPVFVNSRIFLDFSNEETFEKNYELLIRNIFDQPVHRRPPLGVRPSYLNDEKPLVLATAHRVATIRSAFTNERKNAPLLVKEYYHAFLTAVRGFAPEENEVNLENFIDFTLDRMEHMRPLRDDFIDFLEMYCAVVPELDEEALHDFFEEFAQYFHSSGAAQPGEHLGEVRSDYLRFFAYELVVYATAVLIRRGRYAFLASLLRDTFVIPREYGPVQVETYNLFNRYNFTLNRFMNEKRQANRVSWVADKLKERATGSYSFEELKQADIVLYFVGLLLHLDPEYKVRWFWKPETAAYNYQGLPIFDKAVSKRHFDKIKCLFGVETKEELVAQVNQAQTSEYIRNWQNQVEWTYRGLPDLSRGLSLDTMATVR
ncbi:TIR domain-containing protein [Hymenobacter ruber]